MLLYTQKEGNKRTPKQNEKDETKMKTQTTIIWLINESLAKKGMLYWTPK